MSIFDLFLNNLEKNKEIAKTIKPRWKKGDYVRVLKSSDINTYNIKEYLGKKCLVTSVEVKIGMINEPRVEYLLELNGRIEPFWEEELDYRIKKSN